MAVLTSATSSARQFYQGQPPIQSSTVANSGPNLNFTSNASASLGGQTYYVKYTWVSATGESMPSPESSLGCGTGNYQLNVTLPAFPQGVTSANIYISTSAGTETKQGSTTSTSYVQSAPLVNGALPPTVSTLGVQTLYTAPGSSANVTSPSSTAYIKEIIATNVGSSAGSINLYVAASGSNPSNSNAIFSNLAIQPNDTKILSGLNTMIPPGGTIQAMQASGSAITLTISGVEVQ